MSCELAADEGLLGGWGGGVGGAEDEHVGGVVAEGDAVFLEGEDDAAAQLSEDDVALVGADADLDRIGDGTAFDLVDAEDDGIGDGDVLNSGSLRTSLATLARMAMTLSGLALASTLTLRVATA